MNKYKLLSIEIIIQDIFIMNNLCNISEYINGKYFILRKCRLLK